MKVPMPISAKIHPLDGADSFTLMGLLGDVSTVWSIATELAQLFDPAPGMKDILDAVVRELEGFFEQSQMDEDLKTAIATLQTFQSFISVNYKNAHDAGEPASQLWNLLTSDNAAPSLANMTTLINKMNIWVQQFQSNNSPAKQQLACQALSFMLTSYTVICTVYKERSRVYYGDPITNSAGSKAEWANRQKIAQDAYDLLNPVVSTFIQYRANCLVIGCADNDYMQVGDIHDSYFNDPIWAYRTYGWWPKDIDIPAVLAQLNNEYHSAFTNMAAMDVGKPEYGSQLTDLMSAMNNCTPVFDGSGGGDGYPGFINQVRNSFDAYCRWVYPALTSLQLLQDIAQQEYVVPS